MARTHVVVVFGALVVALCVALPAQQVPQQPQQQQQQQQQSQKYPEPPRVQMTRSGRDPEFKPTPVETSSKNKAQQDGYKLLSSSWKEPAGTYEPAKPQSGSLISIEESLGEPSVAIEAVPDVNNVNETLVAPPPNAVTVADASHLSTSAPTTPNPVNDHYPIVTDTATAAFAASAETVASAPVVDPQQKDVHGVYPPPMVFDRPDLTHPMEVVTPLIDVQPCDAERILDVKVSGVERHEGSAVAFLPRRYGCSDYWDISREKISPEISWSNVYDDVFEFSLQLVDLGDGCQGKGTTAGRIHWHITGIQKSHNITLKEGASHDSRLLFGGKEQPNQWLEEYYAGPCPDPGVTGCYRFKVLAHRTSGVCQCGFQDVLFERPAKPVAWVYENATLAAPGAKR